MRRIYRKLRYSLEVLSHIFGGNETEKLCACCGYQGLFETYGHPPRYGCLCPGCDSLERHRLLMLADQENDFFTNKEILHFAPEPVLSKIIRNRAKKYLTADIDPGKADMTLNIENVDQPDGSWDVIVCCHVLEHVNDKKSLTELHRILRPKSLLIVMVPIIEGWEKTYENPLITTDNDRHLHFGQFDHVRYYGNDFRDRLKQFGFVVREYSANGENTVKYGLLRGEKVFLCTREPF